ncbi:MAG: hypothetical protein NZM04_04720 [Methylacidiphilales bacterium]|nr:hypothetical protein [Candidatus Methylacidiphilales bacterium]
MSTFQASITKLSPRLASPTDKTQQLPPPSRLRRPVGAFQSGSPLPHSILINLDSAPRLSRLFIHQPPPLP